MADPWALRHKAWKKRLYLAMVERHALRGAACLHALTRSEARFLRELAPSTPVACVPNGVDLRPLDDLPSRHSVEATYPELAGKFTLLFLGRLHAKKGLDVLADALVRAWGTHDDWHLLLAGPEDGAGAPFLRRMSMLGLRGHVTVVGHVSGETTRRMWGAADAFVLPSRSEGFSMTVLESLAARVPPIVTTACHFPELAEVGAGLVCEPDAESLAEALHTLRFERTAEDRARCGERGRALVEQQFTWETQARRLVQVYRWLADRGPRPDVVEG
jgi:glycosyltransferase involved in cell wall biosynthesis